MSRRKLPDRLSAIGSAKCWALAESLAERAIKLGVVRAAHEVDIAYQNAIYVNRLMRRWRGTAPAERIAACCYADPSTTPEDVADWFGRSLDWAERVYTRRPNLRRRWRATLLEEQSGCGYLPDDPGPMDLLRMRTHFLRHGRSTPSERVLTWDDFMGRWNAALFSKFAQ